LPFLTVPLSNNVALFDGAFLVVDIFINYYPIYLLYILSINNISCLRIVHNVILLKK